MIDKYNPEEISIIVGLGNPSEELKNTYHNIGMLAVHSLSGEVSFESASTHTFAFTKSPHRIFVEPRVFMNESGLAVKDALAYFKKAPSELLVIHDDADIPLGEYRLQFGRGEAGHHGIESIIGAIHTKDFWRLRIGIEQRVPILGTRKRASTYVLKQISHNHKVEFNRIFQEITAHFPEIL